MPTPGALSADEQALLAAADGLIGQARIAMKEQQLHQMLNAVWAVVAGTNRAFAAAAAMGARAQNRPRPHGDGALRDGGGRAAGGDPRPAGDADGDRQAARPAGAVPEAERSFAFLGERGRLKPGTTLPKPEPVFPRYIEAEQPGSGGGGRPAAKEKR